MFKSYCFWLHNEMLSLVSLMLTSHNSLMFVFIKSKPVLQSIRDVHLSDHQSLSELRLLIGI